LQAQLDRLQRDKEAIEKRLQEESSRHEKVIDEFCANQISIHCKILTSKAQTTLESNIAQLQDELHTKTAELNRLHTDMKQALTQTSTLKQVLLLSCSHDCIVIIIIMHS
jgi:DNA anti-recombination protein RmuC